MRNTAVVIQWANDCLLATPALHGHAGDGYTALHAVHEDELKVVFIKCLLPILVIGGPDVTDSGRCDPDICVSIS